MAPEDDTSTPVESLGAQLCQQAGACAAAEPNLNQSFDPHGNVKRNILMARRIRVWPFYASTVDSFFVNADAQGGYALFGFFGVIYGPVLMIRFQTTVDVYQEHYLTAKT